MKVQASGILILIACILTGCGKSMKDVAGVYETAEIKEPQSSGSYYSTTWVLDLAESGTFTLKENKLRKSIVKTREPVPIDGSEISGKWEFDRDSIICSWSEFVKAEAVPEKPWTGYIEVYYSLNLDVQATGSLVSGTIGVPDSEEDTGVFDDYDPNIAYSYYVLKGLRFKRVE